MRIDFHHNYKDKIMMMLANNNSCKDVGELNRKNPQ